jgi:hypothetical protein
VARDRLSNLSQKRRGGASLHGSGEFDIIPAVLQMSSAHRPRTIHTSVLTVLAFVGILGAAAHAEDPPFRATPGPDDTIEAATTRKEVLQTLQDVQREYGADAVMMEGHLIGQAIRGGSIVEAEVSVPGIEGRDGKRFLVFKLETGIIYNDRDVMPATRPARVWSDVVETTLRKFHTLTLPVDGIALQCSYAHKPYLDEADLRAHLSEGRGDLEAAAFYLPLPDVTELMSNHITGQQLVDRSIVLINGTPTHIVLEAPTPTPASDAGRKEDTQ